MTLSDAIRLGAEQRPQTEGALFGWVNYVRGNLGSCAMGAAYEGLTGKTLLPLMDLMPADDVGSYEDAWYRLKAAFPQLSMSSAGCPECRITVTHSLKFTIEHLNDVHEWTREAIADWIDTL
jgi:hypothetical protein